MKKNVYLIGLFSVFFGILFMNFVSALSVGEVGEQVKDFYVDFFGPILEALFGGWGVDGLYLFEKFLLFVMLVGIIYVIVKKIDLLGNNKFVIWTIAIVIPLIGVRFLNMEQIHSIIFSYKWVAIGLTTVLPFLIFFTFIYTAGKDSGILRKVLWIVLIGIYVGIYSANEGTDSNIYVWTLLISIACLLLDNKIMKRFNAIQLMKADRFFKNNEITDLNARIQHLEESLRNGTAFDRRATQEEIKELRSHRAWLIKQ